MLRDIARRAALCLALGLAIDAWGDVDSRYEQIDSEFGAPDKMVTSPLQGPNITTAPNPEVNLLRGAPVILEGIILVPPEQNPDAAPHKAGIHYELGKDDYSGLTPLLEPFLKQQLTPTLLDQIRSAINQYFKDSLGQYVAAIIPVQHVVEGVVVIQVLTGKIGKIIYTGQKWFSKKTLSKYLPVTTGSPINEPQLLDYLSWINRNPFRKMQMLLQPGSEKGITDVIFVTQERFPIRFFSGFDNTGYRPTGQLRLYGGINWGNALKVGDLLSYQYTASTDFTQLQSQVVSYTAYLSSRRILTAFACYGTVVPQIPFYASTGKDIQVSGRYLVPFFPFYGNFLNQFEMGFDWKYLTSNFFFTGDLEATVTNPASNGIMNLTQFLFTYSLQRNWKDQVLGFGANLYFCPWKNWLPFQSNGAYALLRPGSHPRYAYLRTSLSYRYQLQSKCLFSALFRGQISSGTLAVSEQFGLGGADTVRGYFEQQFIADNALLFNLEFYSKPLSLFRSHPNSLTFLAFFDYGYGRNYSYQLPSLQAQNLFGIGPGIRYDIVPYLSLKMDYGFQLKGIPGDHRTGRFHFSLVVSN